MTSGGAVLAGAKIWASRPAFTPAPGLLRRCLSRVTDGSRSGRVHSRIWPHLRFRHARLPTQMPIPAVAPRVCHATTPTPRCAGHYATTRAAGALGGCPRCLGCPRRPAHIGEHGRALLFKRQAGDDAGQFELLCLVSKGDACVVLNRHQLAHSLAAFERE